VRIVDLMTEGRPSGAKHNADISIVISEAEAKASFSRLNRPSMRSRDKQTCVIDPLVKPAGDFRLYLLPRILYSGRHGMDTHDRQIEWR